MIDKITGGIAAIVLGIAANMLTPYVKRALKIKPPAQRPVIQPWQNEPKPETADIESWRAGNRTQLKELFWQIYFYGFSFYAMFAAIYLPAIFAAGLRKADLSLASSRLNIDYVLFYDRLSLFAILVALALYFPCWIIAKKMAALVAHVWHNYQEVTPIRYGLLTTLGMIVIAFLVAGHWIYALFPTLGYVQSVLTPLIVVVLVAGLVSSKK